MSKREIAAAAAKKYILSTTNMTASAPPDRFHSVMALITLGKAEEAENIDREKAPSAQASSDKRHHYYHEEQERPHPHPHLQPPTKPPPDRNRRNSFKRNTGDHIIERVKRANNKTINEAKQMQVRIRKGKQGKYALTHINYDITHGHLEVWTQSANTADTNSDSRDDKARKAKEDT